MFRLVTMLWLMLFFSFSALADYDEGVSAYEKANYGLALKAFEQSAKAGHTDAVSYTHLDVYKRQILSCALLWRTSPQSAVMCVYAR